MKIAMSPNVSFTHNGGWYTLRSIPRFGRDGLWFESDIGLGTGGNGGSGHKLAKID